MRFYLLTTLYVKLPLLSEINAVDSKARTSIFIIIFIANFSKISVYYWLFHNIRNTIYYKDILMQGCIFL